MIDAWIRIDFSDKEMVNRGFAEMSLVTKGILGRKKIVYASPFRINNNNSERVALKRIIEYAKDYGYKIDENLTEKKY